MKLTEKLKQNNIRNCIDVLLIILPTGIMTLEGLNIIPEMPKIADYALVISAFAGVVDIIYRFGYNN
jgi:hypothetical protein